MLDFLAPSWDHLPKILKPRLPPSLVNLKARRLWLHLRPQFKFGDERDKVQRRASVRAKRQLERDEAWARREQLRKERAEAKEQKRLSKENKGFQPLGSSSRTASPQRKPSSVKPTVVRSASAPTPRTASPLMAQAKTAKVVVPGWAPLQVNTNVPKPKLVYPSPIRPINRGGRPTPGMPPRPVRTPVRGVPVRSATAKPSVRVPVASRTASQGTTRTAQRSATTRRAIPTRAQTAPAVTKKA